MSDTENASGAAVPCISLLAVSAVMWMVTVVMIVEAFMRNDPALVGASAYCFIAASALLAFAVWVFTANVHALAEARSDDSQQRVIGRLRCDKWPKYGAPFDEPISMDEGDVAAHLNSDNTIGQTPAEQEDI